MVTPFTTSRFALRALTRLKYLRELLFGVPKHVRTQPEIETAGSISEIDVSHSRVFFSNR